MTDSELKKSSVRANRLEKKRFEIMMSAFDSAKRNVAVDMQKSQVDFKRRLKRYKDRQREILQEKSQQSSANMEEFVLKQLRRRSQLNRGLRPQTTTPCFRQRGSGSNHSDVTGASDVLSGSSCGGGGYVSQARSSTLGGSDSFRSTDEEEEDLVHLAHCQRSKIDLRPCTAWSVVNNRHGGKPDSKHRNASNIKLLQLRGGNLGTPARQVRYLNDNEIEERCVFYRYLLNGYRQVEQERLAMLNSRVDEFCGKKKQRSCPPLVRVGLVSLPGNIPPILRHAMSARAPRTDLAGELQKLKTH